MFAQPRDSAQSPWTAVPRHPAIGAELTQARRERAGGQLSGPCVLWTLCEESQREKTGTFYSVTVDSQCYSVLVSGEQ